MDVTVIDATPPAPGSTKVGDLYIDLQSRTMWLGVSAAVDPAQAVLVSDIVGLLENDDDVGAEAKTYTDAQVALRAPLSHTHTAAQITNFTAAVTTVVNGIPGFNWVPGMVLMYSGSLADIGVGNLAGWVLCDGSNGSPDLRDRFIIGAGNKIVGTKNVASTVNVSDAGGHTHTEQGTALSIAQMPSHAHSASSGTVSADHSHAFSVTSSVAGLHQHSVYIATASGGGSPSVTPGANQASTNVPTLAAGDHSHSVSGQTGGISANHTHAITVNAAGGGAAHNHVIDAVAAHNHALTSAQIRDTLPYYALAFIYKL